MGENELLVSNAYYLTNRTWTYVAAGADVSVGTVGLVADALVSGVVRGDDSAHEPVAGVAISAVSRDGAVTGSPSTHTNAEGQFTVAVPPIPSELSFVPIAASAPYEPNTTFVNASAGGSLDVGTVLLPHMTEVQLSIVDAETGSPISGTTAAIGVCSRSTGYCPAQGATAGGPVLTAQAPVGPDIVHLYASGYVFDTTVLGVVPATPPGSAPVNMGSVSMVPTGAIQLWANISGVSQPYAASVPTSTWPVGEYVVVTACNLDGLHYTFYVASSGNMSSFGCTSECVSPGQVATIQGIPLRNYVTVAPDEIGCVTSGHPTWPIPGDLPVFENYGWVNVTPGRVVNAGGIDLLPGTYIEGDVLPADLTGWEVSACSTDETAICGPPSYADAAYNGSSTFVAPSGCPQPGIPAAATTYCVAAPPGPVEVRVTPTNGSANFTWAFNPPLSWPTLPLHLASSDQDRSNLINLTSAEVSGEILQSGTLAPVAGLPSIEVCPAGTSPSAGACGNGVMNASGTFRSSAPVGWDEVTVSAAGFEPNSTWVYVSRDNDTGTILLTPLGYVLGRVVDSDGDGLYEALIQLCAVANPNSCQPVGPDGLTSSNGSYYGATAAGTTPVGTYEVEASAPGYITGWTWVNVTSPGQNSSAPPIVLRSAVAPGPGDPPGNDPALATSDETSASPGAWVTGRVTDAEYGIGLPNAVLTASPYSGAPASTLSTVRGDGGEFNDSLAAGDYTLTASAAGYYSTDLFVNVSGNTTVVDVGTISLVPFRTATGRLVIDPESWLTGVTEAMDLGPGQATVEICTNEVTICGPAGIVATSGYFNASAPTGQYDLLEADGTGSGPGTAPGGFEQNRSYVNVTNGTVSTSIGPAIGLSVFGIITGSVVNANATSPEDLPVRFDAVTADTTFPVDMTQGETLTANGTFAMVFPESRGLNITAGGAGSWIPIGVGITVNGTSQGGAGNYTLAAGGTVALPPMALEHYGWVDAEVGDAATGAGVPYATVSVGEPGSLWGLATTFPGTGVANGAGFVNVSAPPSLPEGSPLVELNISAPDYTSTLLTVVVNSTATTYVNGSSPDHLAAVAIEPWGWVSDRVADERTGAALAGVLVSASSGGASVGKQGVTTNSVGQYLVDAPPSPSVTISLTLHGYEADRTTYSVAYGQFLSAPVAHLIGDGIVAGEVLSDPGNSIVSGATVTVCPSALPTCATSTTTNGSGIFWIAAAPGPSVITVAATGFVTNTPVFVTAVSDSWVWAGTVSIAEYAEVTGSILGLPSGAPLADATASLCSAAPSGVGTGPCFASAPSGPGGMFELPSPAGDFVLDARAPDYNDTYLVVALAAGVTDTVGVIFVQQYGSATGAVYSASTDLAVPGSSVVACQAWGTDNCSAPVPTDGAGSFVVTGPPGPYELEAEATGYQSSFETVALLSGRSVAVRSFLLIAIGPGGRYDVSGKVEVAPGNGPGLASAVVTASGGTSSPVAPNGSFSMTLLWGSYEIAAEDPG
ncbi:MAG: carboxypeptidase-like regulatory domain-containing protein, partial [Thermoplasmata archaeon]